MNLLGRLHGSETLSSLTEVDVATAHALQRQGAQLVDVREPYEFAAGHVEGAGNIPLGQLSGRMSEIARDRTVLLICRSGNRSGVAQDLLRRRNITDTHNVLGGMLAWQRAGLPVK